MSDLVDVPKRYLPSVLNRFRSSHTESDNDSCWLWERPPLPSGYGYLSFGKRGRLYAHRIALELAVGPPPSPKSFACHTCDIKSCVNPNHLYWGTAHSNVQDRKERNPQITSQCNRGHEWTVDNTYWYVNKKGQWIRQCVACRRVRVGTQNPRGRGKMSDTHCKRGHQLEVVGIYQSGGRRRCKGCIKGLPV